MQTLIQRGMAALRQDDFAGLYRLWSGSTVFGHLREHDLDRLMQRCDERIQAAPADAWPWLLQCMLYLDRSEHFDRDRERALRRVAEWANHALGLDPDNADAHRLLGSAHYWLDEPAAAIPAYRTSHALRPQVDLQVRLFEMEALPAGQSPQQLQLDFRDSDACDYYSAGVSIGKWKHARMDPADAGYIDAMQFALYEHCTTLFRQALELGDAATCNTDTHSFAMCCNNLGILYMDRGLHAQAQAILEDGLRHSQFQFLHQNLRQAYRNQGMQAEAAELSLTLMMDYDLDTALFLDCAQTACSHLNRVGRYADVLEIADAAQEEFEALGATAQADPELLRMYALVQAHHRLTAARALGRLRPEQVDIALAQAAAQANPHDLDTLFVQASALGEAHAYAAAVEAYAALIAQAAQRRDLQALKRARHGRGYLLLYYLPDAKAALQDFLAVQRDGTGDFYTHYYQANCHYVLKDYRSALSACDAARALLDDALLQADPGSAAQLYMMEANCHMNLGAYPASVAAFERSLALHDREDVRENYELARQLAAKPKKGLFGRLFS
jgi:tetratricopeptide (TPR) repeat protein